MVANEFISGFLALVVAYLLGSIPVAYIISHFAISKDIRELGSGNADARNVYHEVGVIAGVVTAVLDVAKGALAIYIVFTLLGEAEWWFADPSAGWWSSTPAYLVMASGLLVVVGHMWSVFLRFNGGSGLAPAIGVLAMLMSTELLLASAVALVLVYLIRNPVLSVNVSLLIVPLMGWYMEESWLPTAFAVVLLAVMAVHFLPTARTALEKAGSWSNLVNELLRREKKRGKVKQKVVK